MPSKKSKKPSKPPFTPTAKLPASSLEVGLDIYIGDSPDVEEGVRGSLEAAMFLLTRHYHTDTILDALAKALSQQATRAKDKKLRGDGSSNVHKLRLRHAGEKPNVTVTVAGRYAMSDCYDDANFVGFGAGKTVKEAIANAVAQSSAPDELDVVAVFLGEHQSIQ